MPIRHDLDDNTVFEPDALTAMSEALERACTALHVNGQAHDREVIAERIIALARHGVTDAKALGDRVIAEVNAMRALGAISEAASLAASSLSWGAGPFLHMAIGDPAPHMMVIGAHAAPSAPQEINDNPFVWRAALRRGFGVGHIDR